ncbi:MAG TPA: CamS family sex pheromone protein [Trichococcus sp.]|uniref:CamS family sex pheromone protein n=1 Tax=Trichococcus TaxID=82802 RepID=UPI0009F907A2|nr:MULTISPECIES: CamS family sex pheromone protein [Trichococcus]MBP6164977.1 CamS family sex pheromone protein [Trichococcus sp.]MBP6247224.1 CamS family sex pheromone protein [Trichococcus sp.]MBP7128642.1 CamS family sex pheromone protein [Trichococcus sp.]MBP8683090.1 CamS family sex pheromone protein [Trichococcus sp.]MBP9594496.1 CamS family sex pheromone protein [Trichococcus sp.]
MNKAKSVILMTVSGAAMFLLASCGQLSETQTTENTTNTGPEKVTVQTTQNQLSTDYYPALIVDGKYQFSQNRGVSLSLNSTANIKDFEADLLDVAKNVFPTDQYFFQEGQVIDYDTTRLWLGRYSDSNPDGLNPTDNGSTDAATREPIYLEQILEQDYMIQNENGFELAGMAIGLAMNSVDYYKVNDVPMEQAISRDKLEEQAKAYANTIITRLRQTEGLESIPIVIGIYEQSAQDSPVGGSYLFEGVSTEGSAIGEWITRNESKVVFPLQSGTQTEESSNFDNFKNEVQDFFPNLNGIVGEGKYVDGQLMSLEIDITTQFYGETEIIAFTQHVTDAAGRFLPQNIPVEITIESINGIESFLTRENDSQGFSYHIFD